MRSFLPSNRASFARAAMVLLAGGMFSASATANLVTIQNPSFETDVPSTDPAGPSVDAADGSAAYTAAPPAWTLNYSINVPLGVFNPTGSEFTNAGDGSATSGTPTGGTGKLVYFNTGTASGSLGSTYQDLTAILEPNTIYTLTAGVGARANRAAMRYYVDFATTNLDPKSGQHIARFTAEGTDLTPGQFVDRSVVFQTGPAGSDPNLGQPLRVQFFVENTSADLQSTDFDNIRLDATAVPEPTALGLIALGGLGLLNRRRRA